MSVCFQYALLRTSETAVREHSLRTLGPPYQYTLYRSREGTYRFDHGCSQKAAGWLDCFDAVACPANLEPPVLFCLLDLASGRARGVG